MNTIRALPLVSIIGAMIGLVSCFLPWVGDVTGIDLFNVFDDGFQRFLPFAVIGLSVLSAILSTLQILVPTFWYMLYIQFFVGVVIMIVTSVFSMWTIGDIKVTALTSIGFWLSYLAGGLMILGGALFHATLSRMSQVS